MRSEVMTLNMAHESRSCQLGYLVKLAKVVEHIRVLANSFFAGLEVDHVNLVESNKGHVESNICLGDSVIAHQVSANI